MATSNGKLLKNMKHCEKRLPLNCNIIFEKVGKFLTQIIRDFSWSLLYASEKWKHTKLCNHKGVFSFIIFLKLRLPILSPNFHSYFMHMFGEYLSWTIYQKCPVPLKMTSQYFKEVTDFDKGCHICSPWPSKTCICLLFAYSGTQKNCTESKV